MKNATLRKSGKMMITVPVEFQLSLKHVILLYLLEKCPCRIIEELDALDVNIIKKHHVIEVIKNSLYGYGIVFRDHGEQFRDNGCNYDYMSHPKVKEITRKINGLFNFGEVI